MQGPCRRRQRLLEADFMFSILLVINTCVAVALIILILLQKTDPAAGGMFGGTGGGGQTVVRNPLARPTAWLAGTFMVLSLAMAVLGKGGGKDHAAGSVMAEAALPAPAAAQVGMIPASLLTTPTVAVSPAAVPAAAPAVAPAVSVTTVSATQG